MHRLFVAALVGALPLLAHAGTVSLGATGACPGPIDVEIDGLTPGGRVVMFSASSFGATVMTQGPCAGTALSLDAPTFRRLETADTTGAFSATYPIPSGACGAWIQAVDVDTCTVSNPVRFQNDPPSAPVLDLGDSPRPSCDDLVCDIAVPSVDPDGDPIAYSFVWRRNGSAYNGPMLNTRYTRDTIPASELADGDVWTCGVVATDGQADAPIALAEAEILDSPYSDVFEPTGGPSKVDLLLVIDDSCSMIEEQQALATEMPRLFRYLSFAGTDFHIGVTTMDASATGLNGALVQANGVRWVAPNSANGEQTLAQMVQVGSNGTATEQGLLTAYRALTPPLATGTNAGFRRGDADLYILAVSDEDDQSGPLLTRNDFIDSLLQLETQGIDASFWTITGLAGGCSSPTGSATAGSTYLAVSRAVGGQSWSICSPDWRPIQRNLASELAEGERSFRLSQYAAAGTLQVTFLPQGAAPVVLSSPDDYLFDPVSRTILTVQTPPLGSRLAAAYEVECLPPFPIGDTGDTGFGTIDTDTGFWTLPTGLFPPTDTDPGTGLFPLVFQPGYAEALPTMWISPGTFP